MSRLFSPKVPKMPEPVKPPTVDDTRQADEELMRLRRRKGRASTFLSKGQPRRSSATSALLDANSAGPVAIMNAITGGAGGASGSGRASVPRMTSAAGALL